MQIQNTFHIHPSQPQARSRNHAAEGREAGFERELASERIRLGTISEQSPTVGHLLIGHPEYGDDCWGIVHSAVNADKPYARIPADTPVYLDPATREISWPTEDGASADAQAAEVSDPAPREGGRSTNASHQPIDRTIEQAIIRAADTHDLSPDLIQAVIRAESNFEPEAVSRAGARGLMQLMPATAREMGVFDTFDIEANIDGGTRYLKQMLKAFDGDLEKALAAYNAGPNTIRAHGGDIPYQETRVYVERVLAYMKETIARGGIAG